MPRDTNISFPEARLQPDDEDGNCPTCGGAGVIDVDRADRRGEHYTTTQPCPRCEAGAPYDDGGDERDEYQDPDPELEDFERYHL
jgi:hypothetical protein